MNTTFTDWNATGIDWTKPPHQTCSPNLVNLKNFLQYVYVLNYLGCHNDRPVREGSKPSVHSWGAALDIGNTSGDTSKRDIMVKEALPFLIWTSEKNLSGIQAIHDYAGDRIWRCNRDPKSYPTGWKKQYGAGGGMGEAWAQYFHIEVNQEFFSKTVDYGKLFKTYLGIGSREKVLLGSLEILDEPYRFTDTRTWKAAPYKPGETVVFDFAEVNKNLKGALIMVTPVGYPDQETGKIIPGYASIWDNDTTATNWSESNKVNPSCVPVKLRDNKFNVYVSQACHLIIEVYAEG